MNKKKVLLFIRSMHGGGAQRAMIRYANALTNKGCAVFAVTLDPNGAFSDELHTDVVVIPLRAKRIIFCIPQLVGVIRSIKPDVMMVTEPACNIALIIANLLSFTKSRLLIREGLFPSIAVKDSPYIQTRIAYRLAPFLYKKADVIVGIASELVEDLATFLYLPINRITLIPINPVVTPLLQNMAAEGSEHPWLVSKDTPIILGVGRLEEQKDFSTLISAFCLVRNNIECKLLIIGEGSLRKDLARQINASAYASDIELMGFSPNPFQYMTHSDVLVLSSRYEGLPNTLIEALACGVPVVSTNCKSGPKDILDDGKYGLLVPVGDSGAMAQAIVDTLKKPIGRDVLKKRGNLYTLENSINAYLPHLFPDDV